ncbi:MAG: YlmH/Sll1252 family protein [Oscillospiraceae bacterium]|nr:YlmH/Sll1252 family protein [Oscillospiraceae bacterium]
MNENELTKKRLTELSHRAFERGYTTFSDFLNLEEISLLKSLHTESEYNLYGGYDNADRCVASFGECEEYQYPISCIKIEPANQKFADELSHRDFLGALMNLGINRSTLGDIIVTNNTGYLFCLNSIKEYILQNLDRIKHTTVRCTESVLPAEIAEKKPDPVELTVSSQRVDIIVAAVFKLSRNTVTQLVNQEKVFINSKIAYKESLTLKSGDIVSVRGKGKFIFDGEIRQTKKNKSVIGIRLYK